MDSNGALTGLQLDALTSQALDRLAEHWGVSREAAIQRAIEQAAPPPSDDNASHKVTVFKQLQTNLGLTSKRAATWQAAVRNARRTSAPLNHTV